MMAKEVTKLRIPHSTHQEIAEVIQKKESIHCEKITWTPLPTATRIDPPEDCVAVIVDVGGNQGAVNIFEKTDGSYVDTVGTEETGYVVVVPWGGNWWFRVSGSLQVGYAIGEPRSQLMVTEKSSGD